MLNVMIGVGKLSEPKYQTRRREVFIQKRQLSQHRCWKVSFACVVIRRRHVRSSADLFVEGMRGYWESSAPRTQL
jgi:hypothetical protein